MFRGKMQAALSSLDYTVGKNSLKKVQLRGAGSMNFANI